jgi:WD40 repeat protein
VLTFSEFNLHMTMWSLTTQETLVIHRPKDPHTAVAFSACGSFMAVGTRKESKDAVSVVDLRSGEVQATFLVAKTVDMAGLQWSPDGGSLVVFDSPLRYLVLVYTSTGGLVSHYEAYENALGVRSVAFSPDGCFLAVSSFDQAVRLLNTLTWKPCAVLPLTHPKLLPAHAKSAGLALAREGTGLSFSAVSSEDDFPMAVPEADPKATKGLNGLLAWSADGRLLATTDKAIPHAVRRSKMRNKRPSFLANLLLPSILPPSAHTSFLQSSFLSSN